MSEPQRLIYTPHPDATPETEAAALSAVYRFLLLDRTHTDKETGIRGLQSHTAKEVRHEPVED